MFKTKYQNHTFLRVRKFELTKTGISIGFLHLTTVQLPSAPCSLSTPHPSLWRCWTSAGLG